ncbi:MAG TPA: DUF4260 domain-containing protein [Actinomycetes bacterium]
MDTLSPAPSLHAVGAPNPPQAGVVTGRPRAFLRVEGLALLVAALVAYSRTGQAWWLLPATLLLPDLGALGYLVSRSAGALVYNLAHATPLPLALVGVGLWQQQMLVVALATVWLAHIGMDRAMAYGFKHDGDPNHTHLGRHDHHRSS